VTSRHRSSESTFSAPADVNSLAPRRRTVVKAAAATAVLAGPLAATLPARAADQALYLAKETGRNKVALPLADSRMITKTSHYTATQLERLAHLAKTVKRNEAALLREALDDLLKKYNDQLGAVTKE